MDNKIKIEITQSGEKRLESLNNEIRQKIINIIKDRKYAPGDESIEITASDIDNISSRLKIIQPKKSQFRQLVLYTYLLIGLILILSGTFYNDFNMILEGNPNRLMLIITGLITVFISVILSFYFKQKLNSEEEFINNVQERKKISELYSIIQENSLQKYSANTQYNDLKGTAALDFHGSFTELWSIFKEKNIDTNLYEPYGISLYYSTKYFSINLLALDKSIEETMNYHGNYKTPLISISIDMSEEEFNALYKRLHIVLTRKSNNNFEIIKELDINDVSKIF